MSIKLLKIDEMEDGTLRFQSQLYVGGTTADFVMRSDGIMRCWGCGEKGFNFYPYEGEYEIVESKEEMKHQPL